MISIDDAVKRIVAALSPVATESADTAHLAGRVPAEAAIARIGQPPFAIATCTGYAVRKCDGEALRNLVGTAPAGKPFPGRLVENDAVRIFSGAALPDGADAIVAAEDALVKGETVSFAAAAMRTHHIRAAGSDFAEGAVLAAAGKRLSARDCALIAAGDLTRLAVRRRPRLAIASIGAELSRPGAEKKPGLIAASTGYGLAAMIQGWGGAPCDFGILPETGEEIVTVADADADLIVTLGGVSVGEREEVRKALRSDDFEIDFWNVAVQPERPLIFGNLRKTPLIGLPGHPVAAMIYAQLFLKPAVAALLGVPDCCHRQVAKLAAPLTANGAAADHIPAKKTEKAGECHVEALPIHGAPSMMDFARADVLIVRPPHAGAALAGDRVEVIPLSGM